MPKIERESLAAARKQDTYDNTCSPGHSKSRSLHGCCCLRRQTTLHAIEGGKVLCECNVKKTPFYFQTQ